MIRILFLNVACWLTAGLLSGAFAQEAAGRRVRGFEGVRPGETTRAQLLANAQWQAVFTAERKHEAAVVREYAFKPWQSVAVVIVGETVQAIDLLAPEKPSFLPAQLAQVMHLGEPAPIERLPEAARFGIGEEPVSSLMASKTHCAVFMLEKFDDGGVRVSRVRLYASPVVADKGPRPSPKPATPSPVDPPAKPDPAPSPHRYVEAKGFDEMLDHFQDAGSEGYRLSAIAAGEGQWAAFLRQHAPWSQHGFMQHDEVFHMLGQLGRLADDGWHVCDMMFEGRQWGAILGRRDVPPDQKLLAVGTIREGRERFQELWKEGYRITAVSRGQSQWVLVMDKHTKLSGQCYTGTTDFERLREWIRDQWNKEQHVTAIAEDDGYWFAVASRDPAIGRQRWKVSATLERLRERMAPDLEEGYHVTALTRAKRGWFAVLSRPPAEAP